MGRDAHAPPKGESDFDSGADCAAPAAKTKPANAIANRVRRGRPPQRSLVPYNPIDIGVNRPSLPIAATFPLDLVSVVASSFCLRPLMDVAHP
jgi:hypothetical protein